MKWDFPWLTENNLLRIEWNFLIFAVKETDRLRLEWKMGLWQGDSRSKFEYLTTSLKGKLCNEKYCVKIIVLWGNMT